jgi:hypothetical protein
VPEEGPLRRPPGGRPVKLLALFVLAWGCYWLVLP